MRNAFTFGVLLAAGLITAASNVVAAPEYRPLPIEQREAAPADMDIPQAVQPSQPYQATQQQPNRQQTANASPPQPAVPANVQWELYNQLQQLQQELATLRGMVEEQGHQITQLKEQQRQRYLDLDHRLNQLKSTPVVSAPVAGVGDPAPNQTEDFDDKKAYDQAIAHMRERKFQAAIDLLERLLAQAPTSEYLPNAQYWLGELYMALTPPDYETAKKHLITLLKDHKDHQKVPDALYKLGMLYNLQGEKGKARVTLEKVIADYPSRQAAKLAKQLISQL